MKNGNILFITADQWRGECLSALGHGIVETPNLDALAAAGMLFRRHYAQATPCAPSRSSMHTGLYMQSTRCVTNGTPLDRRFNNWALEVSAAGYRPSLFGYTDSAIDPRGLAADDPRLFHYSEPLPGFASFTPMFDEVSTEWVEYLRGKGYPIPERPWGLYSMLVDGIDWADGGEAVLPLAIAAEDHETCYMVNRCIDWIERQDGPWITHLSLLRPHPPFHAPAPYHARYAPDDMPAPMRAATPDDEARLHPLVDFYLNHSSRRAPENLRETQQNMANYFALMHEVDANLGRLFAMLKERGHWDSTLIVFTTDHGEQLGDHWLRSKLGFFDQSYHIPLIVRDPTATAAHGRQVDAFTENVDIMPTLLDWLGLDIPSGCDGFSLLPLLESGRPPPGWREAAYWECDFRDVRDDAVERHLGLTLHQCNLSVLHDGDCKYVHFGALPPLFFDLRDDPGEFVNRAEDPAYRSRVLDYAQQMLSLKMNHAERGLSEIMLGDGGAVTRRGAARKLG